MLTDLSIRNVAIIEELHLGFSSGLTVLTGETGAGKSIIIDAVSLLLGGRASAEIIRTGAEEAVVEAVLSLAADAPARGLLEAAGIKADDELIIRRIVSRGGKNRVFLNSSMATLALLGEVSGALLNIYGQHEAQTLLKPDNHLELLDGFGGQGPLLSRYRELYAEQREIAARLRSLQQGERDAERLRDLLAHQVREIAEARLSPGEEEELAAQRQILANADRLFAATRGAYELLHEGEPSAVSLASLALARVREAAAIDGSLAELAAALEEARIQLEEGARSLFQHGERVESDPERLQAVLDRLDLIAGLKKKYGPTVADILQRHGELRQELEKLERGAADAGELTARLAVLEAAMAEAGSDLSTARRQAASRLKVALECELHQLAMPHAIVEVAFTPLPEPGPGGLERGEFLFSPNPGEEPRPLARIASGGELSRLMLALKQIHPESDVPTLVFDEVDSGIGGATAAVVGEKLKRVAGCQQVLCITHMPQVAAHADTHLRVAKEVAGGRTVATVTELDFEERVQELARMLGGRTVTATTIEHARELIHHALGRKESRC
jgi:DNA repair protein RecN (Recombination protein N)